MQCEWLLPPYIFPPSLRALSSGSHTAVAPLKKKKKRNTEIYAVYFFSHGQVFIYLFKLLLFFGGFSFFSHFSSSLSLRLVDSGTAGRTLPHSPAHAPRSFPWERTQGISDRLISLSGFIFNFFFFFPAFFPLGVERWLGVYFRRWEGDRFCNNKPAFLPAARDEWLWNLQTWLPTSAEKEAAWIEGKRFISFRLGGSANFPGAKRRGVKRTGLWSQAHGQTPFFLPFCLIFFPSLSFPPSPPPPTAAEYDLCKNSSGQSQAKPSAGSWYFLNGS